jgi:hypothetical protein
MNWVVLLKNAEKKCESINTESFWPKRAIREERVNNGTDSQFFTPEAPDMITAGAFLL